MREMVDRRVQEEMATVRKYFKQRGFRWTSQREQIVEQAFLSHDHFSAEGLLEMIRRRVKNSSVHLATIYRTLQVLEEGHFVEGLDVGAGGRLFEHVLGHEHHDHVICIECGRICEFHDESMEARKAEAAGRLGFKMRRHSLRIYGNCRKLEETGRCEYHDPEEADV